MSIIKKINIALTLLAFSVFLLSVDMLIQNIKYKNKLNDIKEEINQIKIDYQFLKYNTEQLKEYNGK